MSVGGFNSKDGAIDRMYLYACLPVMFHVSIPKMVAMIVFLKLEYKEMVLGFNSKDGAMKCKK